MNLGEPVKETPGPGRPRAAARLYGLLGVMLACWAANFIFAKVATRELPALLVGCLRTVCAGLLVLPIYLAARRSTLFGGQDWTARDVPQLLAIGVLGLVGNQIIFVMGISRTSVAHSALLTALGPVFVLLGAAALSHERLNAPRLGGMALAGMGVVLLQFGHSPGSSSSVGGDALQLLATTVFAAFTVFGKKAASEFGIITINAFAFFGGTLAVLPYTVWGLMHVDLGKVSLTAWLSVLYMGLFPSIVGYFIYAYALRRLPASRVASVSYFQPVCATLLAVLFLHEQPGKEFVFGAVLILAGVWITQTRGQ